MSNNRNSFLRTLEDQGIADFVQLAINGPKNYYAALQALSAAPMEGEKPNQLYLNAAVKLLQHKDRFNALVDEILAKPCLEERLEQRAPLDGLLYNMPPAMLRDVMFDLSGTEASVKLFEKDALCYLLGKLWPKDAKAIFADDGRKSALEARGFTLSRICGDNFKNFSKHDQPDELLRTAVLNPKAFMWGGFSGTFNYCASGLVPDLLQIKNVLDICEDLGFTRGALRQDRAEDIPEMFEKLWSNPVSIAFFDKWLNEKDPFAVQLLNTCSQDVHVELLLSDDWRAMLLEAHPKMVENWVDAMSPESLQILQEQQEVCRDLELHSIFVYEGLHPHMQGALASILSPKSL